MTSIDDTKNFDEFPEVRFFIPHKSRVFNSTWLDFKVITFSILDHKRSISVESVRSFQVELDFCKAAPNKGGLKEEKGYQVGWIVDVIFRFWKPFITFKMFEEQGYPVCGIALCFFNTTNFWKPCKTFWHILKIFDDLCFRTGCLWTTHSKGKQIL